LSGDWKSLQRKTQNPPYAGCAEPTQVGFAWL
jgi:hypothetical protein